MYFVECLLAASQYVSSEDHFRDLGLALGFKTHQLEAMRTDNKTSITDAAFQMLSRWQHSMMQSHMTNREMLIGQLMQALKQAHLESVTDELLDAF